MEKCKNIWIKSRMVNKLKRANLLIVDEFRMVDIQVISKVLRKFLTAPRSPKYLEKEEYSHLKERNKEVYLSSCWYKSHWSYNRFLAYYNSMMKSSKYFVCGLPYQLAIKEGLLDEEQVKDEMSEEDFDSVGYSMEMEALWFGESEKAFFKFEDLEKNRKLASPLFPPDYYDLLKDSSFKYDTKKAGEIRLVSCDIAGMAGKENDASVYTILRLIPTTKGYDRHISYMESMVGGHTVTQAIRIRQLYEDFDCDYVVLDTQNFGLGIFDQLTQPLFDKERSKEYDPISCINDDNMAERCTYSHADKVIYSIKGSAKLNSEIAIMFRDGFKRGKIRLPINEIEGREHMKKYKGFENLPEETKAKLISSYAQFTLLVNEMINLEAEYNDNGQVKLKEPNGRRKDRFSSTSYGNYVATLLERKLNANDEYDLDEDDLVYF